MITNGESIGQVASQTPESIKVIEKVCDSLILRPVCMLDKQEIIDIARKIDTFETSILPYEDCCTVFTPKHPRTKPKLSMLEEAEQALDIDALVRDALDNMKFIMIDNNR